MTDYAELQKAAAYAAQDAIKFADESEEMRALQQFHEEVDPETVLTMIADLERNQRMLLAACIDMGAIGKALKADMNADGDDLLGMVVDLKAQNTRMLEWLKDISRTSGDRGAVMGARQLLKEFSE
jgi:hypothetical protein